MQTYLVDSPEERKFLVSRKALRDVEVFDVERSKLWRHSWVYCGHEAEVAEPGDFVSRIVGGLPLIFCRDTEGEIRVFHNSCPHKGTLLCREPRGNTKFFRCFYHAWTFSNAGALVALPDEGAYDGSSQGPRERMNLRPVACVGVSHGFVFISFDPHVSKLEDHLGEAADYLEIVAAIGPSGMEAVAGLQRYSVRANWKLAVENALDAYHFGPTHATFIDYRKDTGYITSSEPGIPRMLGNGHAVHISSGRYGRAGLDWEPSWGDGERERIDENRSELAARLGEDRARATADHSRILFVFPNLLLFDILGISVRRLEPTAPAGTDVEVLGLAPRLEHPESRALRLDHVISFVGPGGFSTPDDIEAYESIQRGVAGTAGDERREVDWNDVSRGYDRELRGEQPTTYEEASIRMFWRCWNARITEPVSVDR